MTVIYRFRGTRHCVAHSIHRVEGRNIFASQCCTGPFEVSYTGIDLQMSAFTHGRLYAALSTALFM
jgi:hypothetical protein